MEFKFLDRSDALVFARADATAALLSEHEKLLRLTFPFVFEKRIETGMKVVFQDTTPNGSPELRFFEIRNVSGSLIEGVQEIEAESLGLAELQDQIYPALSVKKQSWGTVVAAILSGTGWAVGNTLVTLPPDEYTYDLYKVQTGSSLKLTLRAKPSSSGSVLGYYANGTQVRKISNYNSDWMKVTVGGKTGYMSRPSLQFYRTVTVAGLPKITMKATYQPVADLLVAVLLIVGLRPIYRVEYAGGTLSRSVDFDALASEAYNGARIEIDRNAYSDRIEEDDRGLYTAIYPVGKDGITISSAVWTVAGGKPADKPSGQLYVEDVNATAIYGRNGVKRACRVEFPEEATAADLLDAAWAYLQTINRPTVSVRLSTYDLAALGYGGKRFVMGERVNVILLPMGTSIQASVVELTRDLLHREKTAVTIGNYSSDAVAQTVSNANDIADIKTQMTGLLDKIYPVGSIYMSVASANPGEFFGGTWARIENRFLVAAGSSYSPGDTGGASSHKHLGTTGYNGSQQGYIETNGNATGTVSAFKVSTVVNSGGSQTGVTVAYTGDSSNLPPYLAVYVWKRTA